MGVTKKNRWPQRIPVKITKKKLQKKKTGGELICKTFGVNGIAVVMYNPQRFGVAGSFGKSF